MHAPSIRAARAGLEEAGGWLRALSLADRVERLQAALDLLADPTSRVRRDLEERHPAATGFAPETVRAGLDLALSRWRKSGLRELVDGELGVPAVVPNAPRSSAVIAAGAIPMPTIEAIVAPLVLGSTVMVRPAHRDPVTAGLVCEALDEVDPALGGCAAVCATERDDEEALAALLDADTVVASGSDASVDAIRGRVRSGTRFIGYGHRLSLAVVGPEPTAPVLGALAQDVSLWDQLGCLSPVAVYALGDPDGWARGLAEALADWASRVPRGEVPLEAAAAIQRERDGAELRRGLDEQIDLHTGRDWTVVREAHADWRGSPLHRFVRVHPVAQPSGLPAALEPVLGQLSTIGFGPGLGPAAAGLAPRSASLGTMQCPPLCWNHDGIGTLRPLLGLPPLGD